MKFTTFPDLFKYVIAYDVLKDKKATAGGNLENLHHYQFNVWLQKNKGWDFEDTTGYLKLLTKENFKAYLKDYHVEIEQAKKEFEAEKTSWQIDKLFKEHLSDPKKLLLLPEKIYYAYCNSNDEPLFHSLKIDEQEIPIFRIVSELWNKNKSNPKETHLDEYAKGFLQGVKHDFVPTIDTPENRKEIILQEVLGGGQFGFPGRIKDTKNWEKYFEKQDIYEYGVRVGKIYKAWSIIFETPKYFEDGFPEFTKQVETPPTLKPEVNSIGEAKFYTDNDFSALIAEIEKLPEGRVTDILEHHYTQAYFPNKTSRLNWLNHLRIVIAKAYPVKEENPVNILMANHWVMSKIKTHVFDLNADANNWQTPEQVKKANHDNRTELLERLAIVAYFEEKKTKVQLFETGNDHFRVEGKLDDAEIYEAANNKNNLEIKEAWRTRDLLHIESIHEAHANELEALFDEKFKAGKVYNSFKTEAKFAKHEIELYEWQHSKYFKWFPILEQWFELLKLKAGQTNTQQTVIQTPKQITEIKPKANPQKFNDVFANEGWEKYIVALQKTDPPLLNESFEFIGKPKKHKGVICSWIKTLQTEGIIKQTVNRSQLAGLLNREFKNLNLGIHGKVFDMVSREYRETFGKQLKDITK